MTTRNRVIYQSAAIFSSTITGANGDSTIPSSEVFPLQRVTDVSFGGEVTRTDINVFGQLASISREIIEEPTVSLDFSYYLADGWNESGCLGLNVGDGSNLISNILDGGDERNYYILTVPEGQDADGTTSDAGTNGMVGIGNAFMSNYSVNISVGDIPNASVSFEAANLNFSTGSWYDNAGGDVAAGEKDGFRNPALDRAATNPSTAQYTGLVSLPTFNTYEEDSSINDAWNSQKLEVSVLRPGDVTVTFDTNSISGGGVVLPGMDVASTRQAAHVQSVTIDVPLSRTPLNKLGNPFAFSRELEVPINVTVNVTANVGDVTTGSLVDLVCADGAGRDIIIDMKSRCGGLTNMYYEIKSCKLDSQSMSLNVGDSQTVDLTFTAQVGGVNDSSNGVFLSGAGQYSA